MCGSIINIPNCLSITRLLLVPVLILCSYQGQEEAFLYLLAVSLLTDFFDGYLARKLGQESELGARLDSLGDFFTYGVMVLGLMWLWPDIFSEQSWFLYLACFFYLIPTITSLLKYGEFPNYHTWAAKISAVLMAPAYYLLVIFGLSWLFRIVVLFHIWVAIEELIITVMLARKFYNVPTFLHAIDIVKRQREAMRQRVEKHRSHRAEKRRLKDRRSGH